MTLPSNSPFKLLRPYEEVDRLVYFGRETETRQIANALMSSKFLLLYGASGTGKTSLVQCGLPGMFSARDWLPVLVRRGAGFPESIKAALKAAYETRFKARYPGEALPSSGELTIRDAIKRLFEITLVPVYLILDQFEELFILGEQSEQKQFFDALVQLRLFEEDLFCKLIIVTREEYLAHFYPYEHQLPFLFEYRFRVEKMRREQLLAVVEKTLAFPYPDYPRFEIAEGAANQILINLEDKKGEIDLSDLQVYLDRLYREDIRRMSGTARDFVLFDTLLTGKNKLDHVLSEFLDQQVALVADRMAAPNPANGKKPAFLAETQLKTGILQLLFKLVTTQGTKQTRNFQEIWDDMQSGKPVFDKDQAEACLSWLCIPEIHLLNRLSFANDRSERYEIWHDRLADQVYKKFNVDEIRQREARITLENKKKRFEETGRKSPELLSKGEIELVSKSLNLDRLTEDLRTFVRDSIAYRKRQLVLRRLVIALIVSLGVTALWFGIDSWRRAKITAMVAEARLLAVEDPTAGRDKLMKVIRLAEHDPGVIEAKTRIYSDNEFYERIFTHQSPVKGVLFANTPTDCFYAHTNDSLYFWQRSGTLKNRISIPMLSVVQKSPSGDRIAAGTFEGNLYQIEAGSLRIQNQWQTPDSTEIMHLEYSGDGETIFLVDAIGYVYALNAENLSPVRSAIRLPEDYGRTTALAYDAFTKSIWIGFEYGMIAQYRSNGKRIRLLKGHNDQVISFAFSPDGSKILTADREGKLNFWDRNGQRQLSLKAHESRIQMVRFSADGQRFFTTSLDKTLKSWTPSGDLIATFKGHTNIVNACSISGDGRNILTASDDNTIRWWKVESKVAAFFGPNQDAISGICLSPDQKTVFTTSDDGMSHLADIMNDPDSTLDGTYVLLQIIDRLNNPRHYTRSGALWDMQTGEKLREFKGHSGAISSAVISTDGNRFLTAGKDSVAILWDKDGMIVKKLSGHRNKLLGAAMSPDQKLVLTASNDSLVFLWDLAASRIIDSLKCSGTVESMAFAPDSKSFATGSSDGQVRQFDLSFREIRTFETSDQRVVSALAFSPDGMRLLVGEWNDMAKMFRIDGRFLYSLEVFSGNKTNGRAINAVAFSSDGGSVCLGTEGGIAQVFDVRKDIPVKKETLLHHPKRSIQAVAFTADGKGILTGSGDGWCRLWRLW